MRHSTLLRVSCAGLARGYVFPMGDKLDRFIVPAVVGFAPVAFQLVSWIAGSRTPAQSLIDQTAAPILIAEVFTIVVALRTGAWRAWRDVRWPKGAAVAMLLLIAVAIGTALLAAPDKAVAASRTTYLVIHLLFGLSVAFLCGRQFRAGDLIHFYLAGSVVFAVVFAAFAVSAWNRPIDWTFDLPAALHIRHIGIYATPMIAFAFGIMATSADRRSWLLALAAAAIGLALSLWTGSRGPAASLGAAFAVGALIAPPLRRSPAWGGALLSLAIAALIVILLPVPADNMGLVRTVSATTSSGDLTTGRMELWNLVLQAILERPLLGYGEGQMSLVAPFYRMAQPHNLVLQLLLAWGVVGLMCSLVLAFEFARRAIPEVRRSPEALAGPLLAMLALLALSMIDAALYHILPISIFAACAGIIAARWIGPAERR